MTPNELDALLASQQEYYLSGATRDIAFRKKSLLKLRDQLKYYEAELLDALYQDLHKSEFEAFITEVGLVYVEIKHQLRLISRMSRPQRVSRSLFTINGRSRVIYEPYGLTLIVSPWNYPINLTLIPLVGAIAAGNVVVLKVSPDAPHVNRVLQKILSSSFSSNHVQMVQGHREVNTMLFERKWNHIFLTGSPDMGRVAMTAAAKYLTPITLELGGKSPCIVDQDANIEMAAKRIVFGKLVNSGQTCIAPDYLFVHKSVKVPLLQAMQRYVKQFFGDNPMENSQYPHIVSPKAMSRLVPYLSQGSIVFGGHYDIERRIIEPTLIENLSPDSELFTREIFGPIMPVMEFDDIHEVIDYVNQREKPLAFYYFSQSRSRTRYLLSRTTSGGVCVNDTLMHIVNPYLPFGGVQNSGLGHYHGKYSYECFSHARSVFHSSTIVDFWFKYPPFSKKWTTILKQLMK